MAIDIPVVAMRLVDHHYSNRRASGRSARFVRVFDIRAASAIRLCRNPDREIRDEIPFSESSCQIIQGSWDMTLGGQRPLARGLMPAQAKLPEAAPGT
ncbi:hypothetical protein [Niveispirillum sp.]|uniref:hypothetical protein n=1 Tax=Niveispirillum sp. TaxID=1917217 RepID=UPI001B554FC9|nr:hypothetical protein [Niveispirillum sp.]MBP7338529.1 hypothetical protein [Niveispirillum sp.]